MTARALSMDLLAEIRTALADAGWGARDAILTRFADMVGISKATLYRHLNRHQIISGPSRQRGAVRPEYRRWVMTAKQLALKVPKDHAPVPLWMAVRQAALDGLIPMEAMGVHVNTLHRVARELGLNEQEKPTRQLWTDHPMAVCEIDASTSKYFSVVEQLEDGDYLLRLNTRVHPDYKNKPLTRDRLRVLVYALWDMHSGYQLSRYTTAQGENAVDSMEFLLWACGEKDDPRIPFHGLIESLWLDQGVLFKNAATRDLLGRLGIQPVTGAPYEKERMGGVEQTHRRRWSWESAFFMRMEEKRHFEITLSDLNAALMDYLVEVANNRPARFQPHLSRKDAWVMGVNRMGGVVKVPEDAFATLATSWRRAVRAGLLTLNYKEYEVEGMNRGDVHVMCDTDGTPRTAIDILTGEKHGLKYRGPVMVGQEFRGIAESPVEKLRKHAHEITATTPIFGSGGAPANVIAIPARKLPAPELENPLQPDIHTFATVDDAMVAFREIYPGALDQESIAAIRAAIEAGDLTATRVRELAQRIAGAIQKEERRA